MNKQTLFCPGNFFVFLSILFVSVSQAQKKETVPLTTVELDQGFSHGALSFVLTSDEKYIVAWSHSNVLKAYSVQTGKLVKTLGDHHTLITGVSVNPWNGVLMSTDVDGNVVEWTNNLQVKRKYMKRSLIMPVDSRGYADRYNVFYGAAHDFGIPYLMYDQKLKVFKYSSDSEGDHKLNVEIPAEFYKSDTDNWLSADEVIIWPEYTEDNEGNSIVSKEMVEYSPKYFHLLNPESIKKMTFLKLKPYLLQQPGKSYDHIWPMSDTGKYIIGELSRNTAVREKYQLDQKDNFSGYLGVQRIGRQDTVTIPLRDSSGFPLLTGSVYKPVLALRKKNKLRWIDLSNLHIRTFTLEQDHSSDATPRLDTSCHFVSVSYYDPQSRYRRWKTVDVRTGKIDADTVVLEIPTYLIKQLYTHKNPDEITWDTASHERYLKDWFHHETVKKYHFVGIDDGPYHFLDLPIDEYARSGRTIPLISAKEFVCPDLEGNLVLYNYPSEKVKRKFKAQGISLQIGPVPGTNLFYSQNTEGNVFFYRKDRPGAEHVAALYATHDGLCIINSENYYFAHGRLNNVLFFNQNNETFPFEQFDLKYNRPDKVLQTLGCNDTTLIRSYHKAYLKRLRKMGFTENMLKDDFHLPEISVTNRKDLPTITDTARFTLELDVKDIKYKLDRINVYINDVPVFGSKGIDLKEANIQELKQKVYFDLSEGKNKVQVSVLNQAGAESYKQTIYVTHKPKKTKRPSLFLVTIGDSKYKDNRYNLTYAAKDAEDIQKMFSAGGYYERIFTYTYTDENVTRENITKLGEELKKAKRDDVVLITVAGHGVLDKDLNYYVATYDMDFANPAGKGIPYEMLESLVDGIAPLRKAIFLDACHSGEVDKEEVQQLATTSTAGSEVKFRSAGAGIQKKNLGLKTTGELMNELFTDLRKGTGATVVSSAGGAEYAMESDAWKNGLFTYCLIRGLKEGAADLNGDGEVMLSELQAHLRTEVTRLSAGAQQPVSRQENISMDFRVW